MELHHMFKPPETPREPMEFLSRSWSVSALQISKALAPPPPPQNNPAAAGIILEDISAELDSAAAVSGNPFSFASSETSLLVMERIMSHSQEVSPRTSGRLSHSGPLNGGSVSDSPPVSPSEMDDLKVSSFFLALFSLFLASASPFSCTCIYLLINYVFGVGNFFVCLVINLFAQSTSSGEREREREHISAFSSTNNMLKLLRKYQTETTDISSPYCRLNDPISSSNQIKSSVVGGTSVGGRKTVGRWLKDRKEKKKEEVRAQNAQLHAAISVAGVAAAIAAIAAATAASSGAGKDEQMAKTDMAVASAATLVAAQCVEAAEAMGAERELLASVVSSAVNVQSSGDIMTLTAAAATALRGAATLKARALKEVWNIASVIPVDKVMGVPNGGNSGSNGSSNGSHSGEIVGEENFLGICSRELLARGGELLKRTRKGDLHWKIVSVYINRMGQVMLKMKSRHIAGTVTKKKKNVVLEVMKDIPAWPGRHLLEGGGDRRYFALKTVSRGVVEFECRSQREYDIWTQGVTRLLSIAADKNRPKI